MRPSATDYGRIWKTDGHGGRTGFEQALFSGGEVFAGYRIGRGNFQPWFGERETNDGGEFNVGLVSSLWRDRAIDDRRFKVSKAELDIEQAEIELFLARLQTQRSAAKAYWEWVAGKCLGV